MASYTALYDACVFYPAPLRDLLMELAITDLFRARWSPTIHDEWIDNLARDRPDIPRPRLEAMRAKVDHCVRDCLVTGYEDLIPSLSLPDPGDRHVLAAAIKARADVIVTNNLRDFPIAILGRYGIEAQSPDDFIANLLDLNAGSVVAAVKQVRQRLKKPPRTAEEYLVTLVRQGLSATVVTLQDYLDSL